MRNGTLTFAFAMADRPGCHGRWYRRGDSKSRHHALVKGDLRGIAKAIRLSRATMRNISENLFFAFLYNALGIPLAAGVLYPFAGSLLSPIIAGAAMSLSSVRSSAMPCGYESKL